MKSNDEVCYVKVCINGQWKNLMHGNLIDIDRIFTNCLNKQMVIEVLKNIFKINVFIDDIAIFTFERFDKNNKGKEVEKEIIFSDKRYLYEIGNEVINKEDISDETTKFYATIQRRMVENHNYDYFTKLTTNPIKDQLLLLTPYSKDNTLIKAKIKKILLSNYLLMRTYALTYDKNALVDGYKIIKNTNYHYNPQDVNEAITKITLNMNNVDNDIPNNYLKLIDIFKGYNKGTISLDKYLDDLYGQYTNTRLDMQTINDNEEDEDIKLR